MKSKKIQNLYIKHQDLLELSKAYLGILLCPFFATIYTKFIFGGF